MFISSFIHVFIHVKTNSMQYVNLTYRQIPYPKDMYQYGSMNANKWEWEWEPTGPLSNVIWTKNFLICFLHDILYIPIYHQDAHRSEYRSHANCLLFVQFWKLKLIDNSYKIPLHKKCMKICSGA